MSDLHMENGRENNDLTRALTIQQHQSLECTRVIASGLFWLLFVRVVPSLAFLRIQCVLNQSDKGHPTFFDRLDCGDVARTSKRSKHPISVWWDF